MKPFLIIFYICLTNFSFGQFVGTPYIIPSKSSVLEIGDSYQGGVIFYLLKATGEKINIGTSSEITYDPLVQHGLIAATENQGPINWANQSNYTLVGTLKNRGSGLLNTEKIISKIGSTYAAGLARAYRGGGYTDWYLPSLDELNKLYAIKNDVGGFGTEIYFWSSSENDSDRAHYLRFDLGTSSHTLKKLSSSVRAIRSF